MEKISALVEQCGLGTIKDQILPVSGGLMHKMYKVQTTTGIYAVKCLNPEIMSRPDAESLIKNKYGWKMVELLTDRHYFS